MSVLLSQPLAGLLDRLFAQAERNDPPLLARAGETINRHAGTPRDSVAAAELDQAFIPVSPEVGRLLFTLVRAQRARCVVEFGTSFGISTLYLAAALRDLGGGRVITTELNAAKAQQAQCHIDEAGLSDWVEIRVGDALQTLRQIDSPIDFVLLDGWKDLYLPVFQLLEPRLSVGALVVADDLHLFPDAMRPYLDYVRTPGNFFLSLELPLGDGVELTLRV